jgi:hypothetical protein
MAKHTLIVALVKSILQVMYRLGPTVARRRRRRRPRHRGRRGRRHHRTMLRGTLDLDRLCRTGGDPKARPSRSTPEQIPNPRVRVTPRPSSPPLAPPAYWPMENSNLVDSPWGRWEPLCAIHGMGPCHTWLHKGNRYSHHRVMGKEKESPKRKMMMWSWSPL